MLSLGSAICLSLLVFCTESGSRPSTTHMTLSRLLRLQRRLPRLLQIDESMYTQGVAKQHSDTVNQTFIREICEELKKTSGILERIMRVIADDLNNQHHIDDFHNMQRYPPIKELQLPDMFTPGSRLILTTTYVYLARVIGFTETLKTQIDDLHDNLGHSTELNARILNALVQIHSGFGVGDYHGILYVMSRIHHQFPDLVRDMTADEYSIPLYLRSMVTRADALNNSYYVFMNLHRLLHGLAQRITTLY